MSAATPLLLDGCQLTLDDLESVATTRRPVDLAHPARAAVARARVAVDQAVARGAVVYGVTTGFGDFADVVIPRDRIRELQLNLLPSHAAGVGEPLGEARTWALMLDPRIHAARPHPGQQASARNLQKLLAGSPLRESHRDCGEVQDAYSLRCLPQIHGACLDALSFVGRTLEIEMNSDTDNPMAFADSGQLLSGGNFHGEPVAIAADLLAIASVLSPEIEAVAGLIRNGAAGHRGRACLRYPGIERASWPPP